jgi:membrane glycosyltransferase
MIPLDADSVMTGKTVLRLVRIMQANPKIGLLQSLISGIPSRSFFERLLHFGPRHNSRLFIFRSTWWQGDSGPFWGHNALIRVAPFTQHCRLPILRGKPPLGGHILSHDQVEAVMMRRGGYEVRVLPEEQGSYEDNPPTVLDFLRRHLRWCQGNLQYLKLRHEPGMLEAKPTHFYLWLALELFFSMGGVVAFVVLAAIAAANWSPDVAFPVTAAAAVYGAWMLLYFTPKIVGTFDALFFEARRYGGRLRLLAGSAIDTVATFLLTPIANVASSIFMVGLLFGQKVTWDGQRRDNYRVSWDAATRALWPVTTVGAAILAYLLTMAPGAVPWFMPFLGGLLLAIPFTVVTSWPRLGAWAARWRILALPEETDTPRELAAVLPWLAAPALPESAPDELPHAVPIIGPPRGEGNRVRA